MELANSDSLGTGSTEQYNFRALEGTRWCYNLWEAAKPWIYGSRQNLISWPTSEKVTDHGYPYVKYTKCLEKSSKIIWVHFLVKFFSLNCTTLVLLCGFDPIGVKLWLMAAAVVVNLVLMEFHYIRSHPLLLNEGGGVSSTCRLVNRIWCSLGYTGFRKKNQLFSVSVFAPLQSMALDVVLLLYPETYHLWAQPAIKLVFCLKYFMFLIGLRLWCGNTSQLWKIPWVIFSLHNPSQPGM